MRRTGDGLTHTEEGEPGAGRRARVRSVDAPEIYHVLYLPTDWRPGRRYPVIVEYAGNGNYRNSYGDVSLGVPEWSNLGFGLSGGVGYLWLCLPYVDAVGRRNQTLWWGSAAATNEYGRRVIEQVCREYGGDSKRVLLSGCSRGAIGCSYLGVRSWPYADSDRESALGRLRRLRGPQTDLRANMILWCSVATRNR
jgi:hypothetical protein